MTIPIAKLVESAEAALLLAQDQFCLVWKEKGEQRHKFVAPGAVRSAIAREPVDSGWISPAVRRCGSGGKGDWAIAWFPPALHKLTIVDGKMKTREVAVPLPGLLFAGCGKEYSVWATRGRAFSADAALFRAPLPNVGSAGQVCWGANRVPPAAASTIEKAFGLFRDAPFNGHWADACCKSQPTDVRVLLFELAKAKAKAFPEKELVTANTSVDRVAAGLAGGRAR